MNSLDIHVWVRSKESLIGSRVENVYTFGNATILRLRAANIIIEPGVRIHETRRFSGAEHAEGFARALKAHVKDLKLDGIEQLGFDRVVRLSFGELSLYAELIPRGMLVLTRGERIIASSGRAKMRDRIIEPGRNYVPPPLIMKNPLIVEPAELLNKVAVGKDLVRGLVRGLGIAGEIAEEAIRRIGLSATSEPKLSPSQAEALSAELGRIYQEALEGKGYLVMERGRPKEANPFRPTGLEVVEMPFDSALDELFAHSRARTEDPMEAERQKLEKSLREAQELESKYKEEARRLRELAERVAQMYDDVEKAIECARLPGCPSAKMVPEGYEISLGDVHILVKRGESVQDLLVRLYREAGELEGKAKRAREAIEKALRDMEELAVKARARELAERARLRKVWWFEKYRWSITSGGLLIVGGRDASQNDSLVRKMLRDSDLFFHADIQGGSAVILVAEREPSREEIEEAATIAACYSRAWKAGLASIDVYWVRGSQVSKSPPAGQYLKTGAFMIYGEKNYLRSVPLRLALGIAMNEEGLPLVMVGHERVVRMHSIAFVILVPGDLGLEESAERVRGELVRVLGENGYIALAVRKEDIASLLPGGARVLKAYRGEGKGLAI